MDEVRCNQCGRTYYTAAAAFLPEAARRCEACGGTLEAVARPKPAKPRKPGKPSKPERPDPQRRRFAPGSGAPNGVGGPQRGA